MRYAIIDGEKKCDRCCFREHGESCRADPRELDEAYNQTGKDCVVDDCVYVVLDPAPVKEPCIVELPEVLPLSQSSMLKYNRFCSKIEQGYSAKHASKEVFGNDRGVKIAKLSREGDYPDAYPASLNERYMEARRKAGKHAY